MKDSWLRCTITPGQFSCEYAVEAVSHSGQGFSLFVCDHDLEMTGPIVSGVRTLGWMRVNILKTKKNLALVQLPQSTLENGDTVTVDCSLLRAGSECPETV